MQKTIEITQEQAEAVLQLQQLNPEFAKEWFVVCKGYGDDWEEYTEVTFDDLDEVADGSYDDHQLWLRD